MVEEALEDLNQASEIDEIKLSLKDKYLVFDILLDHRYPFYPPQFFCRTAFSKPSLNDGRDVYKDVLKGDWKVTKKLYEMV